MWKADIKQIRNITQGAVRIEREFDGIHFYRFTKEQEKFYKDYGNEFYYSQTYATVGIKLAFTTDSSYLYFNMSAVGASARKYFSLDIIKDGTYIGSIDNYADTVFSKNYVNVELPFGDFEKTFELGEGVKEIIIHLPWSANCIIKDIGFDDNSFIKPLNKGKKLLVYGDSITQGYDALRPMNRYVSKISHFLEAEEINKAIGAERFNPAMASLKDTFTPDIILTAYGTNDISCDGLAITLKNCEGFFENLCKNYPDTTIYAITPIWRADYNTIDNFKILKNEIMNITAHFKNIFLVDGFEMVPKEKKYFADLSLHPTDEGFDFYTKNLYCAILNKS